MRKQISICILLSGLLCIMIGFVCYHYFSSDEQEQQAEIQQTETEEAGMTVSSNNVNTYKYVAMAREGILVVYYSDHTTVYLDTGIQVLPLPDEVKDQLLKGIPFENESELFAFLESYSS